MKKPDESRWIRLVLDDETEYSYFTYKDGLGNRLQGPFEKYRILQSIDPSGIITSVRFHEKMDEYIIAIVNAKPQGHYTAIGYKKIPLAVYIDVMKDQRTPAELQLLDKLVSDHLSLLLEGVHDFQIVFYNDQVELRETFSLPFNIRFTNKQGEELVAKLANASWYRENIEVNNFGLNFRYFIEESGRIDTGTDILITDIEFFLYLLDSSFLDPQQIPPLIILLFPFPEEESNTTLSRYQFMQYRKPGMDLTCLHIVGSNIDSMQSFFKEFMYSVIHDFPLHEALHTAIHSQNAKEVSGVLFASPVSNHSLRMTDAVDAFKKEVHEYSKVINPGNLDDFLQKFSEKENSIASTIKNAFSDDVAINSYFNEIQDSDLKFLGESTGLVPLSEARGQFSARKGNFQKIFLDMKSIVNNKEIFNVIRDKQERKADITIDQLNDQLLYTPFIKNWTLVQGKQYRLNVSIGQSSSNSLMEGDVPSIDPLLPDPDGENGHDLDIVIYAKDFALLSPSIQTARLPALGGTDIARFIISSPVDLDVASLRVCIFHKNNLLQAFILRAILGKEVRYTQDSAIRVTLDLSTSQKFTNIDALKPRGLYIGVNDNGSGDHSLFIKKEKFAKEIRGLNLSVIKNAQEKFRELLATASFEGKVQKYSPTAKPGDFISDSFYKDVRAFAKFGIECYSNIFDSNDEELKDKLRDFKQSSDKDITIGRHDLNFSFPWPLLYDFPIETPKKGHPDHPVCMGQKLDPEKYQDSLREDGEGCRHNPGLYTYCLEGFWGIRHRIEQVLADKVPTDTKTSIKITGPYGLSFCDNIKDEFATDLDATLENQYNAKRIDHKVDLVDILWQTESRPSALIVFGHMQTLELEDEPPFPRIITFPKLDWPGDPANIPNKKWIYHELLHNQLVKSSWKGDPLPLVFLINCSNAGLTVDSLNSIVRDFHSAGATAVIGTESDISSDLGARFVKEVLDEMYNRSIELGEAIQKFNKRLFESGVPLAFVFTCFGNNNLKLIK